MKIIYVKTFYLEILLPMKQILPGKKDVVIMQSENTGIAFYKFLYCGVGKDLKWVDRLMMDEEELKKIIQHPLVKILVIYYKGSPAGYIELDGRLSNEIEIAYFGIFKEFAGMQLGRYLLQYAINLAATLKVKRVWLHTCELDHPAAMKVYLQAGFRLYDEKIIKQHIPS